MTFIELTADNLANEHICCAIADKKTQTGVLKKKAWLAERMQEGLKFIKADVRGKVFIEYLPAEMAWRPIQAPGYLFIHCLWVSGKFKAQGYGKQLLDFAIQDAKSTNGLVVLASKKSFLTDPAFFKNNGFEVCDEAPPYYQLLVKRFKPNAPLPSIRPQAKSLQVAQKKGLFISYSHQCPFTGFYTDEMIAAAKELGLPAKKHFIANAQEAQQLSTAFGVFNVFLNGQFLIHSPMSRASFTKRLKKELNL